MSPSPFTVTIFLRSGLAARRKAGEVKDAERPSNDQAAKISAKGGKANDLPPPPPHLSHRGLSSIPAILALGRT